MKLIQRLSLLASIALVAIACDIQQTFDDRINDKQLLVLAPDFADTSVQLVFRDPETLAVIDEDFEVTVYANKRLIDANGNYKNEFIARGGVMEFFVSPEETVSEGDPLQIGVLGTSVNNAEVIFLEELFYAAKGAHSSTIAPINVSEENEFSISSSNSSDKKGLKRKNNLSGSTDTESINLRLEFNEKKINLGGSLISGLKIYDYTRDYDWFAGNKHDLRIYSSSPPVEYHSYKDWIKHDLDIRAFNRDGVTEERRLQNDMPIRVVGVGRELVDYYLEVVFWTSRNDRHYYWINQSGEYDYVRSIWNGQYFDNVERVYNSFPNYLDEVVVADSTFFGTAALTYWKEKDYKVCKQGFNLNFVGAPSDRNLNLIYKATRVIDDQIFAIASFNINSASNQYNSLQEGGNNKHVIAVTGNTLEFAENDQYFIEPQIIELGGEELCGNTYTVTLKPRETHKKHNLNLSMRSEDQSVGVALTFSALLRKQGQDDTKWQTIQFKQGSTSVYLEEGSTYEVKLTLADEPFEFTFTNDLSLVEAAVQATKRNVSRIKDITYSISQTENENTVDAEIVFYDGQSLVD